MTPTPNGEFVEKLSAVLLRLELAELNPDQAVSAILKLIREEVVPPSRGKWVDGWSECREAMLRKLGGEQGEN